MTSRPSNPEEAWFAEAQAARERLRTLSDDEVLSLIRERRVDLTFGIWDAVKERALGERALREVMSYLVAVPPGPSDDYLSRFHAASALMAVVEFPAEMVTFLGEHNDTARRISSDVMGEPERQRELRVFWEAFARHCADRGMPVDWEPPWPTSIPRYRVERVMMAGSPLPVPARARALTQSIVSTHQEKCRQSGESAQPVTFEVVTATDGTQIQRALVPYARANTLIRMDLLGRVDESRDWTHLPRVLIAHESDSASNGQSPTLNGIPDDYLFFTLGYRGV